MLAQLRIPYLSLNGNRGGGATVDGRGLHGEKEPRYTSTTGADGVTTELRLQEIIIEIEDNGIVVITDKTASHSSTPPPHPYHAQTPASH